MALFNTDIEAIIIIAIISLILYFLNKIIGSILDKIKKIQLKQRITALFILRIASVLSLIFLIIEGFPSFKQIPSEYTAILTGAISTAIAFASSGIFSNLISGFTLIMLRPFEVGDLVKIKNDKGIIRKIKLTRIVLETFDYVVIEKSNKEVISSPITNYTIKIGKIKKFEEFKKAVQTPLDIGIFNINEEKVDLENEYDRELNLVFQNLKKKENQALYSYTFRMALPYKNFRLIIDEIEKICLKYKEDGTFRFKPRFHIVDIALKVTLKFRILTFSSEKIFKYQSDFTHDIYKVIYNYRTPSTE